MNQQEASKSISDKLVAIQKLVDECCVIADEGGVGFTLDVAGYGMGGWYTPDPALRKKEDGESVEDEDEDEDAWRESNFGWMSSSSSC